MTGYNFTAGMSNRAVASRKTIIGFPAHGMRKRAAGEIAKGVAA